MLARRDVPSPGLRTAPWHPLYIGGDHDFIIELAQNVPTESEFVSPGDRLEAES